MARIRTIKPEFWTSEQIADCSPIARLLFIGLWNFCDDAGRHPVSTKRLKMEIFPGDSFTDDDVAGWIMELSAAGLLETYTVGQRSFWEVSGWSHQKIDRPHYRFPDRNGMSPSEAGFDDRSTTARRPLVDRSTSDRRAIDERSPPECNRSSNRNVKEPAGVLSDVTEETLTDQTVLARWHSEAAKSGLVPPGESGLLEISALAERCIAKGDSPVRMFVAMVRDKRWGYASLKDEDSARKRRRPKVRDGPASLDEASLSPQIRTARINQRENY